MKAAIYLALGLFLVAIPIYLIFTFWPHPVYPGLKSCRDAIIYYSVPRFFENQRVDLSQDWSNYSAVAMDYGCVAKKNGYTVVLRDNVFLFIKTGQIVRIKYIWP